MKKIQSGSVQTILCDDGRLDHYRLTLWVPIEYAQLIGFKDIQMFGKKFLYCPISKDFDDLMRIKTAAQVIINDMKINKLQMRKNHLITRLTVSYNEPVLN